MATTYNPIFRSPKVIQPKIPAPAKGPKTVVGTLPTNSARKPVRGNSPGSYKPVVFKTAAAGKQGATAGALTGINRHNAPQLRHKTPKPQPGAKQGVDPNSIQGIIQALLAPQLAQYGQQSRDLAARQQAQQDAWRQLTSETDARLAGIPGQIQGDYNNAIHTSQALGQEALQSLLAANPNASEQADLTAIGAPQSQMDAQAAQNQAVFAGGGAVLNYLGGALPGQTLAQQELGKLYGARELPAISALSSKQALATLLSSQNKDTTDLQSQVAAARADATKQAYTIKGQYDTAKARQASFDERIREFNLNYNLNVGKANNAANAYSKYVTRADGSVVGFTKNGKGTMLLPPGSVGQPNRGGTWSTKRLPDGSLIQTNGKTGEIVQIAPPGSVLAPAKGLTVPQLKQANQFLDTARQKGFLAHTDDPTNPLSQKEVAEAAKKAGMTVGQFLANNTAGETARNKAGIGLLPVTGHNDKYIQRLYLALVRDYQVPARQAFDMVSKRFPAWGKAHRKTYFPNANPSQASGAGRNTAYVMNGYPIGIIQKYSAQYGLDPAAVLAYAMTQGRIGSVGDNGTSFGPFQAHIGGAAGNRSPAEAAAWANSEKGLSQMMGMMSRAGARGRKGPDAAAYIVGPSFGRGANPDRDMANARAAYAAAYQMIYGTNM